MGRRWSSSRPEAAVPEALPASTLNGPELAAPARHSETRAYLYLVGSVWPVRAFTSAQPGSRVISPSFAPVRGGVEPDQSSKPPAPSLSLT